MDRLEEIENQCYIEGIDVFSEDLGDHIDAMALNLNNRTGIFLNKNQVENSRKRKAYLMEHEYSHINTSSFYSFSTNKSEKSKSEAVAKVFHVLTFAPFTQEQIKKDLENGLQVWEIAEKYDVDEELIHDALNIYKQKFWGL